MRNGINYEGKDFEEFRNELLKHMDLDTLPRFLDVIKNEEILDKDECFSMENEENYDRQDGYDKLIPNTSYFINIKQVTLGIILSILEMTIQGSDIPIIPTILTIIDSVTKLSSTDGELCIIVEVEKNKILDNKYYDKFKGKCINNNIDCKYKNQGLCSLTNDIFNKVVEDLIDKKVLSKEGDKYKAVF